MFTLFVRFVGGSCVEMEVEEHKTLRDYRAILQDFTKHHIDDFTLFSRNHGFLAWDTGIDILTCHPLPTIVLTRRPAGQ